MRWTLVPKAGKEEGESAIESLMAKAGAADEVEKDDREGASLGIESPPKTSVGCSRPGAICELDVTGRCIMEEDELRESTSEKLKRRPPGVVIEPPGVSPKPKLGVGCEGNMARRLLVGIEIDMLAIVSALVGFLEGVTAGA